MSKKNATYFVSDFHLGANGSLTSEEREKKIVRFLNKIAEDAATIYLVGDVFDYWFEYKKVIPKGFSRIFGNLAELKDNGVKIEFFTGNHDIWMFRYFEDEFGIPIHRNTIDIRLGEKTIHLGHGDGLGPGDTGYKFIKKIFTNKLLQKLYGSIHPNIGLGIMRRFSKKSRGINSDSDVFMGPEKEWLVQYAESILEVKHYDYFVFGHRHLPINYELSNGKSRYINLGDWLNHYSYARFENQELQLLFFENEKGKIFP